MKEVLLYSKSLPDVGGFPDKIAVSNGELLWHGAASACPNPRKPWAKGGAHWSVSYGRCSPGKYRYEIVFHHKYKKCLLINNGGAVPARSPNPNKRSDYYGKMFLSEIFCHCAWSKTWRGSAGCPTLPPEEWGQFIDFFNIGDTGGFNILDWTKAPNATAKCKKALYCPIFEPHETL